MTGTLTALTLDPQRGKLKGSGHGKLPPMLEQYVSLRDEIDAQYPGALLLFQCGDFYETFGEDAERAARLLNIALTHKSSKDFSTSMAGIPIRTLDSFVQRLLNKGVCVAVAEQMELPGAGLVERKVTQLLTPGTVTEERHLTADENYLAAVATGDGYALALLDVSTGEFRCAAFGSRTALYDELGRWRAREVLLAPELSENAALLSDFKSRFPLMLSHGNFEDEACHGALTAVLGELPGVLENHSGLTRACGAVLGYARSIHAGVQGGELKMVRRLTRFEPGAQMRLSEWALTGAGNLQRPVAAGPHPDGRPGGDAHGGRQTAAAGLAALAAAGPAQPGIAPGRGGGPDPRQRSARRRAGALVPRPRSGAPGRPRFLGPRHAAGSRLAGPHPGPAARRFRSAEFSQWGRRYCPASAPGWGPCPTWCA